MNDPAVIMNAASPNSNLIVSRKATEAAGNANGTRDNDEVSIFALFAMQPCGGAMSSVSICVIRGLRWDGSLDD